MNASLAMIPNGCRAPTGIDRDSTVAGGMVWQIYPWLNSPRWAILQPAGTREESVPPSDDEGPSIADHENDARL